MGRKIFRSRNAVDPVKMAGKRESFRRATSADLGGEAVAFGEELGGDAEGDLVRVVGAEGEADGAEEFFGEGGGEAVGDEFAAEDGGFRGAADDADEGKRARGEGAVEDGAVGAVALSHAEHEGVSGQCVDRGGEIGEVGGAEVAGAGEFFEPLGARIKNGETARER